MLVRINCGWLFIHVTDENQRLTVMFASRTSFEFCWSLPIITIMHKIFFITFHQLSVFIKLCIFILKQF